MTEVTSCPLASPATRTAGSVGCHSNTCTFSKLLSSLLGLSLKNNVKNFNFFYAFFSNRYVVWGPEEELRDACFFL